ncbi:unnamed protein product, partial [Closterium sp. NIES-54]
RGAGEGSETCQYVIRTEFGDDVERPRWAELLRSGVAIFDLDFDVIISAMYALSFSAEGDCYWCVPPDPGIAAAALGASASGTPPGITPAEALHTFTLDSGASRCFFRDSTTLTPLPTPVPVRLADPSGGPVVASSSTVLPCPAVPPGSLSGLHLPSFSTNLVSTAALQDAMVTTTTPGGQRVSICTCTRTGRHLATFTRWPGLSLCTLATEPPQVATSAQIAASCSCHLQSHQTLFWHHRLGHPSLPRLRGMHSRLLVSCLPRSLPPLPPSPAPPCLPCVEGRQHTTPHSSSFPSTTAPLQPSTWTFRLELRERFDQDLSVLRLQSDRGAEFSSDLLRDFCRGEGILQSFTLPDSPQQNGIAERRIGLVMEVARTSMIHAAAPHFLWPFAVRYAVHELNLWPRVALPETSPTLRWTGKVGDASVFRVWGSRAFVRDTSTDKLSARAIPCVFLGFVPDAPGWQFYHPTSRRVLPSQDVTFDESAPFYCLFPYRSAPSLPPPLFLAPGPPPVDPLPPQGPAPSSMSHVHPLPGTAPVQVVVVPGAPLCAASGGAASGGAESGGAGSEGARSGGAEPKGVDPGGAESEGADSGGAEPRGAALSGGPAGASPRLSSQQLREWLVHRPHRRSGAPGAGELGDTGAGGAAVTTGAGDPTEPGAVGAGGFGAGVAGVGGPGTRGAGAARAGALTLLGLQTTLAALGFVPSTADPSLFLRTDTSLPPFYVLVYVDDVVFATTDTEALTLVKSELQKRHTCTDLGELRSYLGLQITRDTITLTQSHMVHQVLQRFGFQHSSPQLTPLSTSHSLSAPPSDEWHRKVHWDAVKRVLRYLCSTSGMRLVLGGRGPVVLTGHADASLVDDSAMQRSSQGYTFSLGSGSVSWRSTRSFLVLSSSYEAEIYAGAMAAQELRWLTYFLTDLGEHPRSPPVLYVDNKAMIALC